MVFAQGPELVNTSCGLQLDFAWIAMARFGCWSGRLADAIDEHVFATIYLLAWCTLFVSVFRAVFQSCVTSSGSGFAVGILQVRASYFSTRCHEQVVSHIEYAAAYVPLADGIAVRGDHVSQMRPTFDHRSKACG